MSPAPTSRSADIARLVAEGYSASVVEGRLVIRDIPYLDRRRQVRRGTLVIPLVLANGVTCAPNCHGAYWDGETPCDRFQQPLPLGQRSYLLNHGGDVVTNMLLCHKPPEREFRDYHEMATSYATLLAGHARRVDPSATARPGRPVVQSESPSSRFAYADTATARAGIGGLSERLADEVVAIVGLGGTGSYVLDLVAKCPVKAVHLVDDDLFLQHNAFRAPGAASGDDISLRRAKVDHFAAVYSRMHRGIIPHRLRLDPKTLGVLDACTFAFLCIDEGKAKRPTIERLERLGTPFVDAGMGLVATDAGIIGSVRVTTSTQGRRDHVRDNCRIPFAAGERDRDVYASNIQVADLNALNAALAVIRWKRLRGFYGDMGGEHHAVFDIAGNALLNTDRGAGD